MTVYVVTKVFTEEETGGLAYIVEGVFKRPLNAAKYVAKQYGFENDRRVCSEITWDLLKNGTFDTTDLWAGRTYFIDLWKVE